MYKDEEGDIYIHTHPYPQFKQSGIMHTNSHTQSVRKFPIIIATGFGQYSQGWIYLPCLINPKPQSQCSPFNFASKNLPMELRWASYDSKSIQNNCMAHVLTIFSSQGNVINKAQLL